MVLLVFIVIELVLYFSNGLAILLYSDIRICIKCLYYELLKPYIVIFSFHRGIMLSRVGFKDAGARSNEKVKTRIVFLMK